MLHLPALGVSALARTSEAARQTNLELIVTSRRAPARRHSHLDLLVMQ
jgi:acetolactate synthase regulatory subunit